MPTLVVGKSGIRQLLMGGLVNQLKTGSAGDNTRWKAHMPNRQLNSTGFLQGRGGQGSASAYERAII